jgi:hypothetical protein
MKWSLLLVLLMTSACLSDASIFGSGRNDGELEDLDPIAGSWEGETADYRFVLHLADTIATYFGGGRERTGVDGSGTYTHRRTEQSGTFWVGGGRHGKKGGPWGIQMFWYQQLGSSMLRSQIGSFGGTVPDDTTIIGRLHSGCCLLPETGSEEITFRKKGSGRR